MLGTLEVLDNGGHPVELRGGKLRTLLAALVVGVLTLIYDHHQRDLRALARGRRRFHTHHDFHKLHVTGRIKEMSSQKVFLQCGAEFGGNIFNGKT